jgi:hypothetical protein
MNVATEQSNQPHSISNTSQQMGMVPRDEAIPQASIASLRRVHTCASCATGPAIIFSLVGFFIMVLRPKGSVPQPFESERLAIMFGYISVLIFAVIFALLARRLRNSTDGMFGRDFALYRPQMLRSAFSCSVCMAVLAATWLGLYIGYYGLVMVHHFTLGILALVFLLPCFITFFTALVNCRAIRDVNAIVAAFDNAAGPWLRVADLAAHSNA